jgi:hypothetical protein
MDPIPTLRPAIEQRLSLPKYDAVWKAVKTAYANEAWEEERDYWDYALGLRDSWNMMSRAPTSVVKNTVTEIAGLAQELANKIVAFNPDIRTLKGYSEAEQSLFMAQDLVAFSKSLREEGRTTEAMQSRPRSMALDTAERTYIARALTHFVLSGVQISGNPIRGRASLVAMTVNALLDIGEDDEFDEKSVRDVTEDIVRHYRYKAAD